MHARRWSSWTIDPGADRRAARGGRGSTRAATAARARLAAGAGPALGHWLPYGPVWSCSRSR